MIPTWAILSSIMFLYFLSFLCPWCNFSTLISYKLVSFYMCRASPMGIGFNQHDVAGFAAKTKFKRQRTDNCSLAFSVNINSGKNNQLFLSERDSWSSFIHIRYDNSFSKLNESQDDTNSSCVSMMDCNHADIKLIWGPSGQGKQRQLHAYYFHYSS